LKNCHAGEKDENYQPNQLDADIFVLLNEKYAADCCRLSEMLENVTNVSHFTV